MRQTHVTGKIWSAPIIGGPNPVVGKPKLIPWNQAARQGPGPTRNEWSPEMGRVFEVPAEQVAQMQAKLPTMVRREPKARYRSMLERISADALRSYRATGQINWPKSMWDELKVLAWKNADPGLTDLGGEEQLRRQIQALTRHIVETGEMKQKEKNAKKVVLDYHGH